MSQVEKKLPASAMAKENEVLVAKEDVISAPVQEKPEQAPLLLTDDTGFRRFGMFVALGMLGVFLLWAAFAPLKSAVVAPGKIVVESRNKVVQHLDGGIVSDIYVKEGDVVRQGQPLLHLSEVQLRAQLNIVNSQLWESMANLARLTAERDGKEVMQLPDDVVALEKEPTMAQYLTTQKQFFMARRQAYHSEQSVLKERIAQTKQQMIGLESVIASQEKRSRSLTQDVKDWQKLFEQQYADKVRLRDMERQLTELEGDTASKKSEMARLRQVIAETEGQLVLRQQEYLKEVSDQIRDAQAKRSESEARQAALMDQLNRVEIVAPADGRVVGFDVVTIGAVIEPRRPIMQIVPNEHAFAVIGQIQTTNVDQVVVGQQAEIKFTAFNTNFLPVMYGKVESVGADSEFDEATKQPFYKVRVMPDPDAVKVIEKQGWQLVSGMPADVYIQTKDRTLLNYIIRPFQVMFSRAFNEDDGVI